MATRGVGSRAVDDYIAAFPPATRRRLQQVRRVIRAAAPAAIETISYRMPTFDLDGKHLVHFAGYARHVGFYPGGPHLATFQARLREYKQGKGSVQFPLDQPLPVALIRDIVKYRLAMVSRGSPPGLTG